VGRKCVSEMEMTEDGLVVYLFSWLAGVERLERYQGKDERR